MNAALSRAGIDMNRVYRRASDIDRIEWMGEGLSRPECVLTTRAGDIYSADWRGGVAHQRPDGTAALYLAQAVDGVSLRPNGIALMRDGSFLVAHLGHEQGGVFRLERSGVARPWLQRVEGLDLPPTNFVTEDSSGRVWITVSTRLKPRALGYRRDCSDGFIVRVDDRGAAIAADGLGYTNEVAVHPSGKWLYVNETFARRLSRFPLNFDGSLGTKEVVTDFGHGTYPDGLAFDEEGCAWVVSIVSNRVIRVAPDGRKTVWVEDADDEHVEWVEAAYEAGVMDSMHLSSVKSRRLLNISSIAFAGRDRRTAVLGCLLGDRLATVPMPASGTRPTHWTYPS